MFSFLICTPTETRTAINRREQRPIRMGPDAAGPKAMRRDDGKRTHTEIRKDMNC